MFELSEEFLNEVGIATMPEPARSSLVANIQKLMQNRLNLKLADQLSDEKVDELEHVSTSTDDARKWLGENYPKFESSAEYEQFKNKSMKAKILFRYLLRVNGFRPMFQTSPLI